MRYICAVDLVGIVVDVPPEVYELVRLVVHLTRYLYAECGEPFICT